MFFFIQSKVKIRSSFINTSSYFISKPFIFVSISILAFYTFSFLSISKQFDIEDLLSKNLHYRWHHYSEEKFGALDSKSIQSITKLSLGRLTLWWDQWDTITHYGYTPRRQLCDEISQRNQKYFSLFISGPDGFES